MQNLLFEEMMILSKTEKKAIKVTFSPRKNLIIGDNDVGKSTVIKSLYHTLGADTPQLNNNRWKKANPIYCLKFRAGDKSYLIVRDEKYFGFFDQDRKLIGRYRGIATENGIGKVINKLLGFNIQLESKDSTMRTPSPAYYFLPFYIDQDEGWINSWSSFSGLASMKEYRKEMIDYHLGIKPQKYYEAVSKLHEIQLNQDALTKEKSSLIDVRDKYKARKASQLADIDPTHFKQELEELVGQYNEVYGQQQKQLGLIKNVRNKKLGLEHEIIVLEASIRELNSDYKYLENPKTPDHIGCPTCGTAFENSVSERFGILDDIDYSRNLVDQKKKGILAVENELGGYEAEYSEICRKLQTAEMLMRKTKQNVTLAELIRAEGYKDIMQSIASDIDGLNAKQTELEETADEVKKDTKLDKGNRKQIIAFYQSKMKESLNKLNVHVLTEEDYKSPERVIKSNALGSDLPRSLLAQYVSLFSTMMKFNSFVICPFVIDSPLQQEQDEANASAIFKFIFTSLTENQQLILGTLREKLDKNMDQTDLNIIQFDEKYGLLQSAQYEEVSNYVLPLHETTLSTSA